MKSTTLRDVVCRFTLTVAILAGWFPSQADGASPCPPLPTGTAPVTSPAGGFAIDGDLLANTPFGGIGDWIPGPSGSGGYVIGTNGVPLNPATTFHLTDPFNSGSDNNFKGGLKVDDNPNSWTWVRNPVNSKQDINNAVIHFATDANGHNWLIVSADRFSNNGDSYIDFEFLQNTLSLTTNSKGTGGGFTSAGPNCGRTVNDFILTITFTGGGSTAGLCFSRWMPSASNACGYDYVDASSALPAGAVFTAVNTAPVSVAYGAFGSTTYLSNTFAEAAIDLTVMLADIDPCLSVGIKTLLVKTKESQSPTATIVDFIAPHQIDLKLGPTADAGPDQAECSAGVSTTFHLEGETSNGIHPVVSTTWSVVPGSGTATIDSPNSLSTDVHVTSPSVMLRLTVVDSSNCTKTDDVLLTVNDNPACSISGTNSLCPNSSSNSYSGPAGPGTYAWSISGNGAIVGSTSGPSVSVTAGSLCNSSFILSLDFTDANGCISSCQKTVTVNDPTPPVISCPADKVLACGDSTAPANTGTATATDNCGGRPNISFSDTATAPNCTGLSGINRTWTATDACSRTASCIQHITFADTTRPVITATGTTLTLGCNPTADQINAALGTATATDNCGQVTPTPSDGPVSGSGCSRSQTRTWTLTDGCGNAATPVARTVTWTVDTTPPVIVLSGGKQCGGSATQICTDTTPHFPTASVSDNCSSNPSLAFTDATTTSPNGQTSVTRTWTATDACGNTGSCSFTMIIPPCCPAANSSINSNFNGTPISTANYIWFTANFSASGIPSTGATILFKNSTITITKGGSTYSYPVPDGKIVFSPSASCATTTFDGAQWVTTVPVGGSDEILLSALGIQAPADLSGADVTWSGNFSADQGGISLSWKWAAAVYTTDMTQAQYNNLGVKPTHTNACSYSGSHHAGTPENVRRSVIGGARGGGSSNFTGSWSGTKSVTPCP